MNVDHMWFQKDDATCHTLRERLNLFHTGFGGRIISQNGDVNWPRRLVRLSSKHSLRKKLTIKEGITRIIRDITLEMYLEVMENCNKKNGMLPEKSWWSLTRYFIPYIIVHCPSWLGQK